jgi:murein DD-endopeptidase MepM/ murein hydrolase activator NlpD
MHRLTRFVQELMTSPVGSHWIGAAWISDIWTRVHSWFKSGSAGFDAAIGRSLDTLLTALSNSSLCQYTSVERLLNKITARHQHLDPSESSQFTDDYDVTEIVTHGIEPQRIPAMATVSPRFVHAVSRSARTGFVGLAIVLLWWSWPSGLSSAAHSAAQAVAVESASTESAPTSEDAAPSSTDEAPLAIVNPANMSATQVPTPSPTNDRQSHAQPAFVSMPSLAGVNAVDDDSDSSDETDLAADVTTAPPAVLPVQAERVFETETVNGAMRSEEIVIIAAAPKGATESFLVPTPAGSPTPTPDIPFVKIITVPGFTLPHTGPTLTPTPTPTATPVPVALVPGRLWSNFVPKPASEGTHFWIGRSFPSKIASPNYQFGSTAGGRYRIHHGIDTSKPMGAPVRAAVSGEVVHAGWDDPDLLGPYGGFYGNAVVIRLDRRLPVAGGELDVFVLYGHLSQVTTSVGEHVDAADIVGNVGMTGIAIGPHLHTEVRLGANNYEYSVNPYLWVEPTNGGGAVAVRLLSSDGRTWPGARLTLARFDGSKAVWARQIEIYQSMENIGPDPAWGENGAMGSVPPGRYYIIGRVNGESIRTEIDVRSGETTFVELRTKQ